MQRRSFIAAGAALPLVAVMPSLARAQQLPYSIKAGEKWRTYEITTRIEVIWQDGATRVWLPVPSVNEDWQRTLSSEWTGNAANVRTVFDPRYGAAMLVAEWGANERSPVLEVSNRVATRDRALDLSRPGKVAPLSPEERAFHTAPTELIPTDGIVAKTAKAAVARAKTDVEKARAIYEWVVENTHRDPKTRGCGIGDIRSMLETGNLGGKCADLNALYVGLARAVGLPARDVYGLRVVKSQFGYRSLGLGSDNATRAQHCRAEVWLTGFGWVPVDPADVRKVVLEEKPEPTQLNDPLVKAVRPKLFGAWEMNWLAYNCAHDLALPGSKGPKVGFLMYPQAETAQGRIDSLDPDNFKYSIRAREVSI